MKNQSTFVVLLFAIFLLAPLQSAFAQNEYEAEVLAQLYAFAAQSIPEGYTPIVANGNALEEGATHAYDVTLSAGSTYILLGVCDGDCTDLDLQLYDGYDNLIAVDETEDSYPITTVTVATGGLFKLYVTMYACDVNPCYYGVGVYGN